MVKPYARAGLLNLASLSGLAQVWRGRGAMGIFLIGLAILPAGVPRASAFLRPSLPLRACPGFSLVLTMLSDILPIGPFGEIRLG